MFGKFDEKTALDLAVKEGHLDCVRLLIKKGATVDVRMVYAAARGGHVACLEAVLQHVDTNELYFTSWSMHHPECLKLVLEKCSPINEDRLTQGLVSAACSSPPCVPIFLLYGANANGIASGERRTVLMCSMESASPDTVELLLKSGADPNATDASGRTPLFYAADEGREDLLDMLLKYGADVSIVDNFGGTVLMRATDPKFLNKVLEIGGVDVNAQDVETGRTALDLAITDVACMEVLLKHGATIGKNALIDAARYGSVTAVEFLLDRGAEVNVANDNGDTPLILACQYRSCDSMKSINLLVGLGAEVDAANKQGRTALMCAAARGDRQTVQLLLSRGADVDAVDEKGWTALLEAAMNGAAQCIELLQSKAKAAQKKRKRSA
jgi:ankyrin repeat protein